MQADAAYSSLKAKQKRLDALKRTVVINTGNTDEEWTVETLVEGKNGQK